MDGPISRKALATGMHPSILSANVSLTMVNQAQYIQRRKSPMWAVFFQVVRAALWLVTRPFVWSYRIADRIFDLDKKAAASNLERLVNEVQSDLGYLFIRYGGRIVPELSSGSPSFDWASVVVEVRSLQLRASRDRGGTAWQITAPASRYPWQPLELVCQRFAPANGRPSSTIGLLVDHLPEIEQLFATDSWASPFRP